MTSFDPLEWRAIFDEECITFEGPDGLSESILWSELEQVRLEVTVFEGTPISYLILDAKEWNLYNHPGFRGEEQLHAKLRTLPGFDHELFDTVLCTGTVGVHICWRRGNTKKFV